MRKKKIIIGIPCNRQIKHQTVQSLLDLILHGGFNYTVVIETNGFTVAENRNLIVTKAKEARADYLLFIDDDMTFPPDLVKTLVNRDKDIIGINSRSRDGHNVNTVKQESQIARPIQRNLHEVMAVGTGIMLINMEVFKKLGKPYFAFELYDDGKTKTGEDVYFCRKAKDGKFQVWCDGTIRIGHVGDYEYK